MLENMTKEELIVEVGKLREELYHLKAAQELSRPPMLSKPDGYALPATKPVELPTYRSGQISGEWPANFGKPWLGAVMNDTSPEAVEKLNDLVASLKEGKEKAEAQDKKWHKGWCMRITSFEGIRFLYIKNPEDKSATIEVDTRTEVNGIQNNPQVLSQFANVLGARDIPGVWPRWWKMEDEGEYFVLSRHGLSYVITPRNYDEVLLVRSFFKHLNTIRVRSIDEEDGA